VQLVAGQTITAQAHMQWSGLVGYNDPIHWSFRSDNDRVATASLLLEDHETHNVQIVAVGPGTAAIRSEEQNGFGPAYVRIAVVCGAEPPVRAAAAVVQAHIGQAVAIAAASDIANRSQFTWYLGREGDRSHPLAATGPQIELTPTAYGTQYVWVSAMTPCSASSAEIRVDVAQPRHRAAR
jgi:hypothetical protein